MQLDRSEGQKTRLAVICEAAGMAPQLDRVANPFGVTVMSGGGFGRKLPTVALRPLAVALTRRLTDLSLPAIARRYGLRDHTFSWRERYAWHVLMVLDRIGHNKMCVLRTSSGRRCQLAQAEAHLFAV